MQTVDLSDSERQATSYIVLSHCWGSGDFTTLNRDNEPQFKHGLDTSILPQNFKDAVHATRALGFRYIWIDSLCIVQGKDGDWSSESLLMDKVYMNAEICLAAAAARGAFEGFLGQRNPAEFEPMPVRLLLADAEDPGPAWPSPTTFFAYPHLPDTALRLWDEAVEQSPLNRRGWVLQERLLAPCTVYFTSKQLCWECKGLQALEMIPNVQLSGHSSKDWDVGLSKTAETNTSKLGIYWKWRSIIEAYTRCDPLTKESDKLVAISGMANVFAQHLESRYYAGLWEKFLPLDLLWDLSQFGQPQRPGSYRAPTWSWASFDGEISWTSGFAYPADGWIPLVEVRSVNIQIETDAQDAMGQIRPDAELVLYGHLVPKDRLKLIEVFKPFFRSDKPDTCRVGEESVFLLPLVKRLGLNDGRDLSVCRFRGLILERVAGRDVGSRNETKCQRLGTFVVDNAEYWRDYGLHKSKDGTKFQDPYEWHGWEKTEVRII